MATTVYWYIFIGVLFTLLGAFSFLFKRLPLTSAMIYLPIGYFLGTEGVGLLNLDPYTNAPIIERIAEAVVVISLFTAGLKLRAPQLTTSWFPAYRLASISMLITILLISLAAVFAFGFSWGAAVLLGAILAPTDPVLASDVQVKNPSDKDPLRITLTAEAGFNDGAAFPFVLLGLGLLGLHELGNFATKWLLIDVVWQILGGLLIGGLLGTGVARIILWLRQRHEDSAVLDDFLTVGLVGLSYGVALLFHTYGFLAVFAAGLSLRRVERLHNLEPEKPEHAKNHPAKMARAVLTFNEQLERIGEVASVVLVGALLGTAFKWNSDLLLIPLLFLVIRPMAVWLGLWRSPIEPHRRHLIGWFGIRGIGSIYYLYHAITLGLPEPLAERLVSLVLTTVAISIVAHGFSVTPLMHFYQRRMGQNRNRISSHA